MPVCMPCHMVQAHFIWAFCIFGGALNHFCRFPCNVRLFMPPISCNVKLIQWHFMWCKHFFLVFQIISWLHPISYHCFWLRFFPDRSYSIHLINLPNSNSIQPTVWIVYTANKMNVGVKIIQHRAREMNVSPADVNQQEGEFILPCQPDLWTIILCEQQVCTIQWAWVTLPKCHFA